MELSKAMATLMVKGCDRKFRKVVKVEAVQLDAPITVRVSDSTTFEGAAGDYLVLGVVDDLYILNGEQFEKTYVEVKRSPNGTKKEA